MIHLCVLRQSFPLVILTDFLVPCNKNTIFNQTPIEANLDMLCKPKRTFGLHHGDLSPTIVHHHRRMVAKACIAVDKYLFNLIFPVGRGHLVVNTPANVVGPCLAAI